VIPLYESAEYPISVTPSGTTTEPAHEALLVTTFFKIVNVPPPVQATVPSATAFAGVATNESNEQINAKTIAIF
jgi:hypothetical protein